LANIRGMFTTPPEQPLCIVDIGAASTNIGIVGVSGLMYSYETKHAGDTFTMTIAESLNINPAQAEEQKATIGLSKPQESVFLPLTKALHPIVQEIQSAMSFVKEKYGQDVSGVILVGGSARLLGIVEYMSSNLSIPVEIGKSVLGEKDAFLEYIVASGLALRALDKAWSARDPGFAVEDIELPVAQDVSITKKETNTANTKKATTGDATGTIVDDAEIVTEIVSTSSIITKAKNKRKMYMLISVVVIGSVLLGGAFW